MRVIAVLEALGSTTWSPGRSLQAFKASRDPRMTLTSSSHWRHPRLMYSPKPSPRPTIISTRSQSAKPFELDGMVNLLDIQGGDKVDFWILKNDEFDRSALCEKNAGDGRGIAV